MKILKYVIGGIVISMFVIATIIYFKPKVMSMINENEQKKNYQEVQKKIANTKTDSEQGVWNKIVMERTNAVKGVMTHSLDEPIILFGYEMKVSSIQVTKKWNRKWDKISPDSFEKGWGTVNEKSLSRDYSYLEVEAEVKHKIKDESDMDFSISCFSLGVFSKSGNYINNYDVQTANSRKKMYKNPDYFFCPIKLDESKKIDFVFICKDKDILGNNLCLLDLALSSGPSNRANDFGFYRLPSLREKMEKQ